MPDHPALIRIGNRPLLELVHVREGLLEPGLHFAEEFVGEADPAHVQVQAQILVLVQPIHVPLPQLAGVLLEGRRRRPHGVVSGGRIG